MSVKLILETLFGLRASEGVDRKPDFVDGLKVGGVAIPESTLGMTPAETPVAGKAYVPNAAGVTSLTKICAVTNGTQAPNKAIVNNADGNQGIAKVTELYIGTSGSEVKVTATAPELSLLASQPATITGALGVAAAGAQIVTLQVKNAAGANLSGVRMFNIVCANDADGSAAEGLDAGAKGNLVQTATGAAAECITDANGQVEVEVSESTSAAEFTLYCKLPNGTANDVTGIIPTPGA